MSHNPPSTRFPVQSRGLNFYDLDDNLQRFLQRKFPGLLQRQEARLRDLGEWVGGELDAQAEYSDRYVPPVIQAQPGIRGQTGPRRNQVIFNPRYEEAQREIYRRGVVGLSFADPNPEPHSLSFVMGYLLSHSDIATHCPVTMTGAVAYVVQKFGSPEIREKYLHESTRMDGHAKTGGTWATEKHSGSDVARTQTTATEMPDGTFQLTGQKWFASNASSGLAVATARRAGDNVPDGAKGLGLYLVPSHIDPKWSIPNHYEVTALKDKLGTRALATAELQLDGAIGIELVPPPHGLRVMMEALGYSRVHNAMGAAGVMHRAYIEAMCWTENRETFGKKLIERPMIQKKLAHLAVEHLAASALAFEAARSFDESQDQKPESRTWMRIVTAVAKHRTAQQAVHAAQMAVELVGGNGYTEEWPTARLFRDAMVLPVWEGPEQIQALELIRVLAQGENGADDGGAVLVNRLNRLVGGLPAAMKGEHDVLAQRVARLKNDLDRLKANPQLAELIADDLLNQIADTLTYALLCDDAAWDLHHDGNAKKRLAAQHYADHTFPPKDPQMDAAQLKALFGAVVRNETVPTPPADQGGNGSKARAKKSPKLPGHAP